MKNNEEVKKNIEKRLFTKKSFTETQIWIYSSFLAISLAFFFSLLGANDSTTKNFFTDLSIYTYSISLVSNAFIVLIFSISRDEGDLIHQLNLTPKMSYIIRLSWISFIISVLFTIGIFSIVAMILTIVIGIILFVIFNEIQKDIYIQIKREHELEMEEIRNDGLDKNKAT